MRTLLVLCVLAACAPSPDGTPPDDVSDTVDRPDIEPSHPCDTASQRAFDAGTPWTTAQKDACLDGCENGDGQGFDQGRLTCLMEGEPCPECLPEPDGSTFDIGYHACYPQAYSRGYTEQGCGEP